ncbi:MAG: hypothetical protein J6S51_04480 [Kiritimatiellae bacterium]|nr:hypothetical protein [Kiritimatiellia bacterium]
MKNEKTITSQIEAAKKAISELGDMRPGHLSMQKRASGRNVREYTQLSYTFQKRSHTDYVQPDDIKRIKSEIENYNKFKELCERIVALSIEKSKLKTKKRSKSPARKSNSTISFTTMEERIVENYTDAPIAYPSTL